MFDGLPERIRVFQKNGPPRRYPELNAYQQSYLLFIAESPGCLSADICREYMHSRDPKKVYDTVGSLIRRGLVRQTRLSRNRRALQLTSLGQRAVFDMSNQEEVL